MQRHRLVFDAIVLVFCQLVVSNGIVKPNLDLLCRHNTMLGQTIKNVLELVVIIIVLVCVRIS